MVATVLLAMVLGTGAGAAVAGPSNIEVFGWHPVTSSARSAAADTPSPRHDRPGQATTPQPSPTDSATPAPTDSATPAPTASAEPTPQAPDPAQMVAEVVAATNAQRTAAGLGELAVSTCVTEQVTGRVAHLVETDTFEHPPLEPVLSACTVSGAGENLAKGYPDGAAVVDGWMHSESHKTNLLGSWTEMGVACQQRADGQWLCGAVYTRA